MDNEGFVLHAYEHTSSVRLPTGATHDDEHCRSQRGEPSVQCDYELWKRKLTITLHSGRHNQRSRLCNLLIRLRCSHYLIDKPQKVSVGNWSQACAPQCCYEHDRLHDRRLR